MSWIIDRLWRIIGLLEHPARKHKVVKAHCASIDVESPMADWIAKLNNHGFWAIQSSDTYQSFWILPSSLACREHQIVVADTFCLYDLNSPRR